MCHEFNYIMSELDLICNDMTDVTRNFHNSIIGEILGFHNYISTVKLDMDTISDLIVKEGEESVSLKHHKITSPEVCAEILSLICKNVGEIFYTTWLKEMDYDLFPECFFDDRTDAGCKYINLMSLLIINLIDSDIKIHYLNMIKFALSENIKGNIESSYALCLAFGSVIFSYITLQHNVRLHVSAKIKEVNSLRLSRISSRPKSRQYDEVMIIINKTIAKYNNASVTSLVDKVLSHYESQGRKPPTRNTLRKWIADSGYKVQGKPTNKYKLEV